ncbi:hypothetical protein [Pedobacter cryophilus]|uniref:Uncharacterized protein n=1 Tax=Pedobacter cryophilus TaxID=2571271 RepID=A0A4U1BY67_9SPHI|nr:hypothetical protein [Pedobacter cryophilus]TKB96329.1 hypothetical protein FA046_14190 [Pedobacter cryophilus]
MKKYLSILFMLFLGISMNAKPLSLNVDTSLEELTLNKNKIIYNGMLLGKFNIQSKELDINNKEKIKVYHIIIFCKDGKEVAQYELQFNGKPKKNSSAIVDATLKTTRDNVKHNPSNFLDFSDSLSLEKEESEIVQFEQVVKYLLSYHYL